VFVVEDDERVAESFDPQGFGLYCGMVNEDFGPGLYDGMANDDFGLVLYHGMVIEDSDCQGCGLYGGVSALVSVRPLCLRPGGGIRNRTAPLPPLPCLPGLLDVLLLAEPAHYPQLHGKDGVVCPSVSPPIWHLPSHPSEGVSL
jgi:hypothetical protein